MKIKTQNNSWIELSKRNYFKNLDYIKGVLPPDVEISVLLKANAYGHGWREVLSMSQQWGISFYCVFSFNEAEAIINGGLEGNILVLGNIPSSKLQDAVKAGVHIVAYNPESLKDLEEACNESKKNAFIHLKLETGFTRQGIDESDLLQFLAILKRCRNLIVKGVYTHFSTADELSSIDYLIRQAESFNKMVMAIENQGFSHFKKHAANSAAAVIHQKLTLNMVRIGILQFGLWPSNEIMDYFKMKPEILPVNDLISPVLSWKTKVIQIKHIRKDVLVGYGGTHAAKKGDRLAIIPVGYADGFDRKLSNSGEVLIGGSRAPVCGRVSMNMTAVDISHIPDVKLGDEVVIIGRQNKERISAEDIAALLDTINYEVVTRINSNIPRIIV